MVEDRITLSFLHLVVFEVLFRLKSVTHAAEALDMPQSTLSRHLKFLRNHFADPLFVRTSKGLEPTFLAASIAPAVVDSLEIYRTRFSTSQAFDPAASHRNFLIAASDIGHLLTLPHLVIGCSQAAPDVRFTAVPLRRHSLVEQLESGQVDVAIGSFPDLIAGIREQTLFTEEYVCVVPRTLLVEGDLSLAAYCSARHILVDGKALGHIHEEVENRILELIGASRMRIVSENFLLSAHIAERSDMILTVPSRVAAVVKSDRVCIVTPPITLPGFRVKQYWHDRFDHEPGNVWIRTAIARLRPGGWATPVLATDEDQKSSKT